MTIIYEQTPPHILTLIAEDYAVNDTAVHSYHLLKSEVWRACDTKHKQERLQYVRFKDGYVYAINTKIAIKQSLTKVHGLSDAVIEVLNNKNIHCSLFAQLKKANSFFFTTDGINCFLVDKKGMVVDRFFIDFTDDETAGAGYPWEVIDRNFGVVETADKTEYINVDAKLLNTISKCLFYPTKEKVLAMRCGRNATVVTAYDVDEDEQQAFIFGRYKRSNASLRFSEKISKTLDKINR